MCWPFISYMKDLPCLKQEIAILVNMVKAGKTVGDVSSSMSRGSDRADEASFVEAPGSQADRRAAGVRGGESKEELMMMERASKEARMKQFAKQQQRDRELEQQREREREDKILKRHLFGVPPPSDKVYNFSCFVIY